MEHEVLPAQFTAGLRGLGLLRSWPFLEAETAAAQLTHLAREAGDTTRGTLDVLDTGFGYAAWSESYDERVNPLVLAEQPAMSLVMDSIGSGHALDAACGTGRCSADHRAAA